MPVEVLPPASAHEVRAPVGPSRRHARTGFAAIVALLVVIAATSVVVFRVVRGSRTASRPAIAVSVITAQLAPSIVSVTTSPSTGGGWGSGMIISASGDVLTSYHIIAGAKWVDVVSKGPGNSTIQESADVLGYDPVHDVAVLRVPIWDGDEPIVAGDPSTLHVGDPVVALGHTQDTSDTSPIVSVGFVAGLASHATLHDGHTFDLNGLITPDAATIAGESGGPIADGAGRVVGMIAGHGSQHQLFSDELWTFVVPINTALAIANDIMHGRASPTIHLGM